MMIMRQTTSILLALFAICLAAAELTQAAEPTKSAADPHRPASIAVQEVPVVPPELTARLAQYQDIRTASFQGWSPDGKGILIGTRFGNSTQLHRVYMPGGRREQVTFYQEPAGGRFIPQAKDGALLVTMSQGGNENDQVYLLDRTAYRTLLLTDGKSRNLLGPVRHDGAQMIIHSNRRNGRDTDLFMTATRTADKSDLLLEAKDEHWTATDWSLDGSRLLLNRYVSINESYPSLMDVSTKSLKPLPFPGNATKASFGSLVFSRDGRWAYLSTTPSGEFQQLAKLNLETLQYQWLMQNVPWDVSDIVVDPTSGAVAVTVNEDGASKLFLLNGAGASGNGTTSDVRRELKLPLGIISGLDFSPDGKQLGFTLARPDAPADAYSLSLSDGQLTRWTYSEVGGLNPATFVAPTRIKFKSFDGREVPAYFYRPRTASAKSKAPVLINIHGGPEGQYRPLFTGATQFAVNELGMAVIHPNVRGSAGYGKTYLLLDNAERREDSVKDIGALLDWIAQQPELDASRVAVSGGSYGGYMVLASLVHFGDRIRAGIDIVGIANFLTFLERTSPYRQDLRRAEYGDERKPEMRAVFERISPAASADKIKSALLVAHGRNDPRVPFSEAEQIAEKVRAAGRPVWTVYADNEGHGFAKKDNRDYLTAVEMLFLKEHLK